MILSQKKKSFSLSIGLQSWNKTNAENLNRKKSMKEMLMKQKNVKDYEILNTNIKRKLTLFQQLMPNNKQDNQRTIKSFTVKQKGYSTQRTKHKEEQKYTKEQKSIIDSYLNKINQRFKSQIGNPFEMALVEMIQKQDEMVKKRQKDLLFWKNKVKILEQKYQKLNIKQGSQKLS